MSDHFGTLCIKGLKTKNILVTTDEEKCGFTTALRTIPEALMIFIKIDKQPCIAVLEKELGDYSFSTYAKFSKKLTFLIPYQEEISFSENFAYVLNEWTLGLQVYQKETSVQLFFREFFKNFQNSLCWTTLEEYLWWWLW